MMTTSNGGLGRLRLIAGSMLNAWGLVVLLSGHASLGGWLG